ncbi:MAG: glutathione S-transferase [Gammaproteobacteria bacterium]|jgi:hypothetical protein|nr:glutathione S-transferase [Gammaproteobacteria bacterium]
MRKLYDFELSGSCYKVRLLLNILNIPYEKQNVDFVHKEHKNSTFLALNPFGFNRTFMYAPGSSASKSCRALFRCPGSER